MGTTSALVILHSFLLFKAEFLRVKPSDVMVVLDAHLRIRRVALRMYGTCWMTDCFLGTVFGPGLKWSIRDGQEA